MYYYNNMQDFVKEEPEGSSETEEYVTFDEYDDMLYATNKVLMRVANAIHKLESMYEKCVRARTRLESVGSFDYESIGKLGCRVSGGSCKDTGSKVIDLIELEDQYKETLAFVESERQTLKAIIWECPGMTEVQKQVLFYRYDQAPSRNFDEIAEIVGLKNYDAAWYRYKKAYAIFAMWVVETDYIKVA